MAGNVVTMSLVKWGADIIKVGIGSRSVCTTPKKAGVVYPQLSAITECADAAQWLWRVLEGTLYRMVAAPVLVTCPKAFGTGGDFMMIGGTVA